MKKIVVAILAMIVIESISIGADIQNHYFDEQGYYVYSIPAYAGSISPKNALRGDLIIFSEGYWPKLNNSKSGWVLIDDYYGKTLWFEGKPKRVTFHGPPPAGWSMIEPDHKPSLIDEKIQKSQKADAMIASILYKQTAETIEASDEYLLAIAAAGYFDPWESKIPYKAGKRLMHNNILYVVKQDVTSQSHQPPGSVGMLAIYRPIEANASGNQGDPIPFINGMDAESGKYYLFEGKSYQCKGDMKPCVWNPGTAGLWQWELVK